jgi:hypothetical protein
MDDKPLVVLPYGRTREQQEALERKKEKGRRGWRLLLLQFVLIALFCAYALGYVKGKLG